MSEFLSLGNIFMSVITAHALIFMIISAAG